MYAGTWRATVPADTSGTASRRCSSPPGGRRSGVLRRTGLIYGEDAGDYVVVGSNGGSDRHPHWYLNALAEPRVRVQVAAETFDAVAREAQGEERTRLWEAMAVIFPQYLSYRKQTGRRIPVVVLEPRRPAGG